MEEHGLIRIIKLISKFVLKQTIVMHTLFNISRSKGSQIVKLGYLIEYNIRNIYLEKSYTKYCGETISKPFFQKSKLNISLDQ